MKTKITDLNEHLFAQLERLGDEDLTEEQILMESKRADSMVKVADKIIDSANTSLKAVSLAAEYGRTFPNMPAVLGLEEKE